jgi:hypothetical protein
MRVGVRVAVGMVAVGMVAVGGIGVFVGGRAVAVAVGGGGVLVGAALGVQAVRIASSTTIVLATTALLIR